MAPFTFVNGSLNQDCTSWFFTGLPASLAGCELLAGGATNWLADKWLMSTTTGNFGHDSFRGVCRHVANQAFNETCVCSLWKRVTSKGLDWSHFSIWYLVKLYFQRIILKGKKKHAGLETSTVTTWTFLVPYSSRQIRLPFCHFGQVATARALSNGGKGQH